MSQEGANLERAGDRHLTAAQFAGLVDGTPPDAAIRDHLARCPACSTRLEQVRQADAIIRDLRDRGPFVTTPDCPPVTVWPGIVAGGEGPDAGRYLQHAATCGFCGDQLRQTAADFQ